MDLSHKTMVKVLEQSIIVEAVMAKLRNAVVRTCAIGFPIQRVVVPEGAANLRVQGQALRICILCPGKAVTAKLMHNGLLVELRLNALLLRNLIGRFKDLAVGRLEVLEIVTPVWPAHT